MDGNDLGLVMRLIMGVGKLLKVILKVLFFFGFGWFLLPISLALVFEFATGKPFSATNVNFILFFIIDKVMWYSAFPLAFLTFTQNIVRLVKKTVRLVG